MGLKKDLQSALLLPTPEYAQKREGMRARDYLIRNYGAATVQAAETQVCLDILVAVGIVKPSELIGLIEDICKKAEAARMRQAGMDA